MSPNSVSRAYLFDFGWHLPPLYNCGAGAATRSPSTKRRGFRGPQPNCKRRFAPGDVPARRVGPPVGFRTGEFHFVVASRVSFAVPGEEQPDPPKRRTPVREVLTLYTGLRLTSSTELLCDVQETGGHGVGEALGLAGYFNLDVVRNPVIVPGLRLHVEF